YGLAREPRRHDEGGEPRRVALSVPGQDVRAVVHALDRVQVKVEMRERGALAGDVDQVGGAPVQQEAVAAAQLDHVVEQPLRLTVNIPRPLVSTLGAARQ